ncbi:MAG: hypothetical protein A2X31_06560 [Elusimicrobia bacterium GWB2_63_22]|nr:MAG: hypothetical protein A2X31_06560 [Elusimicrobia bacterium GWB2_63_22]
MTFTRTRLILAVLLLAAAAGGGFAYFKYRSFSRYLADQIGGQAAKKLGREVKFKSISFSPLKGVVIKEACVSRRPDFSKGSFFCAEKAVIRPELGALLRNKVYFSRVSLDKPVLKVRERGGRWDFEDLLALLPETDKGLYLTWNASELVMRGAALEADLETSGLSLALGDADISLSHFSSFGGNYGLEAEGLVRTVHKGKLVSARVKLDADANFEYGGLSSSKGSLTAEKLSYGAITLERFAADWTLFNLRKPLTEKNYTGTFSAAGLVIPGQENSARDGVSRGLALFSAAMGKPAPKIEDIEMSEFGAAFRLDDSAVSIKDIKLRTNFLALDASLAIDGPSKTAQAGLSAEIGANKLAMSASGPLKAPEIKPLLSATLSAKFKEALAGIEAGLLKVFPVTGE